MQKKLIFNIVVLTTLTITMIIAYSLVNKKPTTPELILNEQNKIEEIQQKIATIVGDFEIYPNQLLSTTYDDGEDGYSITLITSADISKVTSWQMEELEEAGWTISDASLQDQVYQTFLATKDTRVLEYEANFEDSVTVVYIFIYKQNDN